MAITSFVAFDLETTGTDPGGDAIIEIGAVRFDNGQETAVFNRLINPEQPVPRRIQNLTGITEAMVATKDTIASVLPAFLAFCGDLPLVAHNADFDLPMLRASAARTGTSVSNWCFDTAELSRIAVPLAKSHRLGHLSRLAGMSPGRMHRAEDDARVAGYVFLWLLDAVDQLDLGVIQACLALAAPIEWSLRPIFEAAEEHGKARGERGGLGFIKPAPKPLHGGEEEAAPQEPAPLDVADVAAQFQPGGAVAEAFPSYELRPQQMQMARLVAEAFNDGHHLLMEAGTGTGKSLAYLLPAVQWARQNGEKVVISTGTINLQEQLWEKDIPFLQEALGSPVSAALVKGRGNYICLRKWEESLSAGGFFMGEEERRLQMRMVSWLGQTETADRAELNLIGGPAEELWRQVQSETETCLGPRCKWYKNHCFAFRARRRAREADILVVNHALLFADIASGNQVLPPFRHLIIDEAHHLEAVATEALGTEVDQREVLATLAHLFRGWRGEGGPGLLSQLKRRLTQPLPARPPVGLASEDLLDVLIELVQTCRREWDELSGQLLQFAQYWGAVDDANGEGRTVRLKESTCTGPLWAGLQSAAANVSGRLLHLYKGLQILQDELEELERPPRGLDSLLVELQKYSGLCVRLGQDTAAVLRLPTPDMVHWVEAVGRERVRPVLRSAPIDVGPSLKEKLFDRLRSVVMTSATLTVGGSFEHVRRNLGLHDLPPARLVTCTVPSPFNYRRQALLLVPDDLPSPKGASDSEYTRSVQGFLNRFLVAVQGRTLVLFTSHRQLRAVYAALKDPLAEQGITLLAQGIDGGRSRLVEEFKAGERAVLLGSSSFWEGVDIPGEELSCVVMVKLPFSPPDHPVMEARIEDLQRRGLSSFAHLSLPQAVIRFKQGFGRLVRTRRDKGVVVVLDNRVSTTRYGSQFIRSLPGPSVLAGPSERLVQRSLSWLAEELRVGADDSE